MIQKVSSLGIYPEYGSGGALPTFPPTALGRVSGIRGVTFAMVGLRLLLFPLWEVECSNSLKNSNQIVGLLVSLVPISFGGHGILATSAHTATSTAYEVPGDLGPD